MAIIIDYGQQFRISIDDLLHLLSHSEVAKLVTNGAQVSAGLMVNGMFPRHAEVIANAHSEAADILRQAANA